MFAWFGLVAWLGGSIPVFALEPERRLYDGEYGPESQIWAEGEGQDSLSAEGRVAVSYSGHTYDLFANLSGGQFLSFDGRGAPLEAVIRSTTLSCPDARWTGDVAYFCEGQALPDVVAHEFVHGYSQYTHDLPFSDQGGALNESYSDIFGEAVELLFSEEPRPPREVGECPDPDAPNRWVLGQGARDLQSVGIRDMWSPACLGHPDRVIDPVYRCGPSDGGGIHPNASIPNRVFSLLVDGGAVEDWTVEGIGLTRALNLYWVAMTQYQDRQTRFADHAEALGLACADLVGGDLRDPSSGDIATVRLEPTHCDQLQAALEYAGMWDIPSCETPNPDDEPARCGGESVPIYEVAFDTRPGDWPLDDGVGASAWHHVPSTTGDPGYLEVRGDRLTTPCDPDAPPAIERIESPPIPLPSDASNPSLELSHAWHLTLAVEGGHLSVSVDDGPWVEIPRTAYLHTPPNVALRGTNPLRGSFGFTGASGELIQASRTFVDLTGLVEAGQSLRLALEYATGTCEFGPGWRIFAMSVVDCIASSGTDTTSDSDSDSDSDPDPGASTGTGTAPDTESETPDDSGSGCNCSTHSGPPPILCPLFVCIALVGRRPSFFRRR